MLLCYSFTTLMYGKCVFILYKYESYHKVNNILTYFLT